MSQALAKRAEMGGGLTLTPSVARSLLPSADTLATMFQLSEALYQSGLLPAHIKSSQAAFAIIQKGQELGIPAMYSLSNITCINGKPACNAELMLALIYRDHGDTAVEFLESTNEKCLISYLRRGWTKPRQYSFAMEDARRAQLSEGPNWKKYPAAMLRARCISAVARMAFPDSIAGMYTPEELGATVNMETGEIVDSGEARGNAAQLRPAPTKVVDVKMTSADHQERERLTHRIGEFSQSLRIAGHPDFTDVASRDAFVKAALIERGADEQEVNAQKLGHMSNVTLQQVADILEGEMMVWKERQAEEAAHSEGDDLPI